MSRFTNNGKDRFKFEVFQVTKTWPNATSIIFPKFIPQLWYQIDISNKNMLQNLPTLLFICNAANSSIISGHEDNLNKNDPY